MTFLMRRSVLTAVIVLLQLPLVSYGKPPKKTKAEGLVYAAFSGGRDPAKPLMEALARQVQWDNGENDAENPQHLKLRFVKADDQVTPKGAVARYRVFAEGAPRNKVYVWGVWQDSGDPISQPGDLYANERGLLLTHRPLPEEAFSLQVPGSEFYISPEADSAVPLRYGLYSRDTEVIIPGTLVPQPIASVDHGCRLEVRIAQPNAAAVLLVADGFPLDSKVPLVVESESETLNVAMDTDSGGHAIVAAFPFVSEVAQGNLKATAEGPDCLPSVTLPWGGPAQAASPVEPKPQANPPAKKKLWPLHH